MANLKFEKEITALVVIDPYNDFISEGGKIWDRIRRQLQKRMIVFRNMLQVLNAARKAELRVFYALHRRYRPGDYETWKYIAPIQKAAWSAKGLRIRHVGWRDPQRIRTSTGRYHGPGALVFQWFCQHGSGFTAQKAWHSSNSLSSGSSHTRAWRQQFAYAVELGYEVTVVKDATADYSDVEMHAALDVNLPNYASAIVTRNEVVDSISSLSWEQRIALIPSLTCFRQ